MDEEIERLTISVRADTASFARDVNDLRGSLEGPLQAGVDRAGRGIETALVRAVRSGKLGFEDLRTVALSVLAEISAAAVRNGIQSLLGDGSGGGGGGGGSSTANGILTVLSSLFSGAPGRATGGPVSPGRAYMVGERGPELFVPAGAGRVEASGSGGGGGGGVREVRVAISVNAGAGEAPGALARSSRQVARAVKAAIEGVE